MWLCPGASSRAMRTYFILFGFDFGKFRSGIRQDWIFFHFGETIRSTTWIIFQQIQNTLSTVVARSKHMDPKVWRFFDMFWLHATVLNDPYRETLTYCAEYTHFCAQTNWWSVFEFNWRKKSNKTPVLFQLIHSSHIWLSIDSDSGHRHKIWREWSQACGEKSNLDKRGGSGLCITSLENSGELPYRNAFLQRSSCIRVSNGNRMTNPANELQELKLKWFQGWLK